MAEEWNTATDTDRFQTNLAVDADSARGWLGQEQPALGGARPLDLLLGGRWHSPGLPVVYTAGSASLAWLVEAETPVLRVPSAVMPLEWNYLLNPRHPLFYELDPGEARGFAPDLRLLSLERHN